MMNKQLTSVNNNVCEKQVSKTPIKGHFADLLCGECFNKIYPSDKFCSNCGRKINRGDTND